MSDREYARAGQTITLEGTGAPSGLLGNIGPRIYDKADVTIVAWSAVGVREIARGNGLSDYNVDITIPAALAEGTYSSRGSSDSDVAIPVEHRGLVGSQEELVVNAAGAPLPVAGPSYATLADARGYTDLDDGLTDAAAEQILRRAERDVDDLLVGPDTLAEGERQASGLKYDPATLTAWRAAALTRAVSAQFEYRILMGEEFFARAQHATVRGPEFATSGELPYIGPKVTRELNGTGLLRHLHSGSARVGGLLGAP